MSFRSSVTGACRKPRFFRRHLRMAGNPQVLIFNPIQEGGNAVSNIIAGPISIEIEFPGGIVIR